MGRRVGKNYWVTTEESKNTSPTQTLVGFSGKFLSRKLKPLRRSRSDKIREKALEQDYQDKCNALACRLRDHKELLELMLELACCNGRDQLCNSSLCQELKERHASSIKLIKFLVEQVGTTLDVLPKQTEAALQELISTDEKLRAKLEKVFQLNFNKQGKGCKDSTFIPSAAQRKDTSSVEEFYQIFVHGIKDDRPLVLMLKKDNVGQALRDTVQEKCPKLPSSFILLHQGRKISLQHTLREQGLTQDCNIHVHFGLCGGMDEEENSATPGNGGERKNKDPRKWKKAQVVAWINEVCEMYEIEEADVSKLKTLSGAGLNQLERQDWKERSPNQGDLFHNLWVKLMKNSEKDDACDTAKSPPSSPRNAAVKDMGKDSAAGNTKRACARNTSTDGEKSPSLAIADTSQKMSASGEQGPFGTVENVDQIGNYFTIDELSKRAPTDGELIAVKGLCSSRPRNHGGAGTVLLRNDPVQGETFLELKVDIRACPDSKILTKHIISTILNAKLELGEPLFVRGKIERLDKGLKSMKQGFEILPFKIVVDSDQHAAFRKDVKMQRSYMRQLSRPWPTEYGIFPAEGSTQESLFHNDILESTRGNLYCPPDASLDKIKESAVALKNSLTGDIFVGVNSDGTVIGSRVSPDAIIQKRDDLARAVGGILPSVHQTVAICTSAAQAHEFVEKEKDFVAAMWLQSKTLSSVEDLEETDDISIFFRIHVVKGASTINFVKPEHTHAYIRVGTETKLMTDYEDLFSRLESLASRNIPEKTPTSINQEVNKASTYEVGEQNYHLFKKVSFETEKTEFKVIFGDPKKVILNDYVKKYACSFLNSDGGDILFGIEEDRTTKFGFAVGVSMSVNDRMELVRESSTLICNFWPPVDSYQFFTKFINVKCDMAKNVVKYPKTYVGREEKFVAVTLQNVWNVPKVTNFARTRIGQVAVLRLKNNRFGLLVKDSSKINVENFLSEMENESNKSKYFQIEDASFDEVETAVKDLCVIHLHVRASPYPIHLTSPFLTFCLDQQGMVTEMKPLQVIERFTKRDYHSMKNPTSVDEIKLGDIIATGSYSEVFKAVWCGKQVAAKRIRPIFFEGDYDGSIRAAFLENFKTEWEILRNLEHDNIVQYFTVILPPAPETPIIVTELLECDLAKYIRESQSKPKVSFTEVIKIMLDVAEALHYLHSLKPPIVHGNLVSNNILLTKSMQAKIAGFGLAKAKAETHVYAAPEIFKLLKTFRGKPRCSKKSDMFSFGVLMLETIIGHLPEVVWDDPLLALLEGGEMVPLYVRRMKDLVEMATDHLLVHSLVYQCLETNPEDRPSAGEIIAALLEISMTVEENYSVPPEILARGPLALRAYNNALKEGRTCVRRMPVMFIGPERSGKTSLKKSLKGQPFKLGEESTVGIDFDPSHFKVSTEIWKAGEKDKETSAEAISYENLTAQLIASSLMEEKQTSEKRATLPLQSEHFPLETVGSSSVLSHSFTSRENQEPNEKDLEPVHSGRSLSTGGDSPESSRRLALTSNASHYDSKPPDVPNVSYYDSKPDDVLKAQKTDDMLDPGELDQQDASNVPEEIATLLERLLQKVKKVEEEEDIYSVLWDFGGQSVYYVTHPLFLTPRAIYLLAYDLSRNPHDKADPLTKQGMFKKLQDNFSMKTNLDFLDFWMTSVASLTSQREDQPVCSNRSLLPEKLPPVFLVCTHADEPHGGVDPRTLANEIFDFLQNQPYSAHLFEHVFVVDNSKSGGDSECPEVLRLRREVLAVAKKLPQMEEEIPIKWLQYERALQVMKEEGHPWISLERAKEIASEVCKFDDDQEILTLLNFLHDQRILIHFDNTPELNKYVVLDPQWLIDVFKKVITVKPYDQEEKEFKYLWRKLEKTGILEEKLLEHAWEALLDKDETFESLIAIMEKFSLMCLWPSPNTSCGKQYLVPSMLTTHPPQGIMKLLESAQFPSLFLKFESRQIPPNLFPRLVLQFFQWWTDEFPRHASPQLCHNFARFYVSPDVGCSVVLLCHPSSSVEVVLLSEIEDADLSKDLQSKMGPSVDESRGTFEVTVARAVRRQLLLLLECMQKEFCWLNNIRCKVSFLCPTCSEGGRVNFCQAHLAEGCKQQECLHFWSESELCNCPQGVFCRKSADAVEIRVQLKQFAPWFVPLNEKQETTVEDDGGFLPFVEVNGEENGEERALALSCAAQDVFPLQSCDPKDIQVRLQQDSQLEHAFLENPETAIKRMESGKERALALPCAVKDALLSQACDAKDVVDRLQEEMQLEQTSLENPERETKRMIRFLARTAKYSNRRDVVRHLRDITPAGTTGPLLHENLDVQNLPLQQSRDLSVHLSGGDEWMMVAEGLGLTPAEIRFLDKRSRNPFEDALGHSRNQQYLNVGQLYDVLVDCGYPIYADFL